MRSKITVIGMPSASSSQQSGPSDGMSEAIAVEVGRQKQDLSELSLKVDELQVKDAEVGNNKLLITKTDGTEIEFEGGGGGGGMSDENVTIVVASEIEGVSVDGLQVSYYIDDDSSNKVTLTTDSEGKVAFTVPAYSKYTVIMPFVSGCARAQPFSHYAGKPERTISVVYKKETRMEHRVIEVFRQVGVNAPTRFGGCNVYIDTAEGTQTLVTDSDGIAEVYIPYGTEYDVRLDDLKDDGWHIYGQKYVWHFTSQTPEAYKAIRYNDIALGLFIVDKDGGQYSLAQWQEGNHDNADAMLVRFVTANLVANDATFAVKIDDIANGVYPKYAYGNPNVQNSNFASGHSYEGLRRTELLMEDGDNKEFETAAADYCHGRTIAIGDDTVQGFLGAAKQHLEMVGNESELDAIIKYCRPLATKTVSTMLGTARWSVDWSNASNAFLVSRSVTTGGRTTSIAVLVFYAL